MKIREAAEEIYPLAKFTAILGGCLYELGLDQCRTYSLCDTCNNLYQEEITRIMGIIEGVVIEHCLNQHKTTMKLVNEQIDQQAAYIKLLKRTKGDT